jgi:UDP-N-acetylmuramoyl-tripeptide--D-alanyl-D-alanine ligase
VELRLSEIAEKMQGTILQGNPAICFHQYNIDSRLTQAGELFFALKAERDGHEYVLDAIEKGAAGAVISKKFKPPDPNTALIQVPETLKALQSLAQKSLLDIKPVVVGVTGSIGKTTTKEFIFTLISSQYRVLKSEGNFNNHIGLPLSILRLSEDHEAAVLEYGMSTPGEIQALTRIAAPDIAVITNIKPVHLEFFSSLEEIACAKKEILEGMKPEGTAILNGDDELIRKIAQDWRGKKIYFGLSAACRVRASNIQNRGWEGISFDLSLGKRTQKVRLPFLNRGYLFNFLAAAGVAQELQVSIENILERSGHLKLFNNRGSHYKLNNDMRLIDDSYNSNPDALESALKSLTELPGGRKVAVLGDMLELGKSEIEFHIQAGNILITVGPLSRYMAEGALENGMDKNSISSFQDSTEASEKISDLLRAKDIIMVKGSRGIHMEEIIKSLMV